MSEAALLLVFGHPVIELALQFGLVVGLRCPSHITSYRILLISANKSILRLWLALLGFI